MKPINEMSQAELAAYIHDHLRKSGVDVVLSGGAAVGIYSNGEYVSKDIDFVNAGFAGQNKIEKAMEEIGFLPSGRHFEHPESDHIVEFPPGPLQFGYGKVKDISEIEALAKGKVAPSTGERLQAVVRSLSSRKTGVQVVQLVDDKKYMPPMWQKVLDHLNVETLEVDRRSPAAASGCDLHTLQKTLMGLQDPDRRGRKLEPVKLKGDGSVIVLRARSRAICSLVRP